MTIQNRNFRKVDAALLRTHCEDAAFLFTLREKALEAPNYRIIDIYDVEERLRGHLSAILHAADTGAQMVACVLDEHKGSGEMFVAAFVVLHRTGAEGLLTLLEQRDPDLVHERAVTVAMAWSGREILSAFLSHWTGSADHRCIALALDVCAELRIDPKNHLTRALSLTDPRARAGALRTAGYCGREDHLATALASVGEPGRVGIEAAIAATLLGDRATAPRALFAAVAAHPAGRRTRLAAELAPIGLDPSEAKACIRDLPADAETARWRIVAVGALGLADSLDWLVRQMTEPTLARIAGAAFSAITGANLKDPELERAEFPDPPDDPVLDANPTEAFCEGNLPWPETNSVAAWLEANRARFAPDTRYLFGQPAWSHNGPEETGLRYQAQFRTLALELAMRKPSARLANWHAPVTLRVSAFHRNW